MFFAIQELYPITKFGGFFKIKPGRGLEHLPLHNFHGILTDVCII
jgi:hypothetical protein